MARNTQEWAEILTDVGVAEREVIIWAPIFARVIKDTTFSKGDEDLLDFLPTILHESGMLRKLRESGYYTAKRIRELGNASPVGSRWRSLVPRADELAANEAKFFEAVYGGRLGNGPEGTGDGAAYPGRGLIQITGKANYTWLGEQVGQDLLGLPGLAEQPTFALELSIGWWEGKVPDSKLGNAQAIRRVVNGGDFGLDEVRQLINKVRTALYA